MPLAYSNTLKNISIKCERKQSVAWMAARDGKVPVGSIMAGQEDGNKYTFIGRIKIKGDLCFGRVVPSHGSCYAIRRAMEHRRRIYEVLVNKSNRALVWRKDFGGHAPDTAVELGFTTMLSLTGGDDERIPAYYGRVQTKPGVVIPGYIVPTHGSIHIGYETRETIRDDYEVLCEDFPCSLKYLAAKKIRDIVRKRDKMHNAKYSTKIANVVLVLERLFFVVRRKEPRRRECSEDKLELPRSLVSYLRSPRIPGLEAIHKLDFNSIMMNCCPPEENCTCHMWIEITLQGLY